MSQNPFILISYRDSLVSVVQKVSKKIDEWDADTAPDHEELDKLLFKVMDTVVKIKKYLRNAS